MNDLITNGEAKTNEPYLPPLDRIEDKLSYFIGKLVQHHVQKAAEANVESVARLGRIIDKLKGELDELKADQVSADTVNDIVTERLARADDDQVGRHRQHQAGARVGNQSQYHRPPSACSNARETDQLSSGRSWA